MPTDIHDPSYVGKVFDRCAGNYRTWAAITSFGFVRRWRQQCIAALGNTAEASPTVVDLMAGTGEIWRHVLRRYPDLSEITAIDISSEMHRHAIERLHQERHDRIEHVRADALTHEFAGNQADLLISSFGLKTLNQDQQAQLARQIHLILKLGGRFSLVEATDPKGWLLRPLYRLYLDRGLPMIEKLVLRGADDFSHLGVYTKTFSNGDYMESALKIAGFQDVRQERLFFGTACLLTGTKR